MVLVVVHLLLVPPKHLSVGAVLHLEAPARHRVYKQLVRVNHSIGRRLRTSACLSTPAISTPTKAR